MSMELIALSEFPFFVFFILLLIRSKIGTRKDLADVGDQD